VDAFAAGQLSRSLDALHSVSYFAPEAAATFGALGLEGRMAYFAARSAPMGAVGPKVVAATFFNFSPDLIAGAIPAAWRLATPDTVIRARYEVVDQALPRLLGPELTQSAELAHAAALLRRTAESIPSADGRPLTPGTPSSTGHNSRMPKRGMPLRCCGSTAVTATSRSCWPMASTGWRR
jgi:hypothetical protein